MKKIIETKEYLGLDKKKLKGEDRRFLMSRNFNETIAIYQGSMHNTAITLSLIAILISVFTLVYQTKLLWIIRLYVIISLVGLIIYITKLKIVQRNLSLERKKIKKNYDELFKYHFVYANKIRK